MPRKTVLVTGASRGIGKAVAIKFAKKGYNVVISCVHRAEQLEQTRREIESFQAPCLAYLGDMGDLKSCETLFSQIRSRFGGVDVLVNNAGISYIGLLQDMSSEDWERMLHVNLTSVFNCCKLAIPYMVRQKQGKIVNVSGGGCPDVPYLAALLTGQCIGEAEEPRVKGQTLCSYSLQRAFEEARRLWRG